jgi:hypothetical protein
LAEASLFVASPCYGGQAEAGYLRSLLALQSAAAERGLTLQIKLTGGEALVSRARGSLMAAFLASGFDGLLFAEADAAFAADDVFRLLESGRDLVCAVPGPPGGLRPAEAIVPGLVLISRACAQKMTESYGELSAGLRDVQGAWAERAAMVFDSMVEPESRRYLSDYEAFARRWRALGGEVWALGCAPAEPLAPLVAAP